jgi:hypothetical protein
VLHVMKSSPHTQAICSDDECHRNVCSAEGLGSRHIGHVDSAEWVLITTDNRAQALCQLLVELYVVLGLKHCCRD